LIAISLSDALCFFITIKFLGFTPWDFTKQVLGPAAIKVETGNLDGFVQVFRKLALDPDYYERCQRATLNCRAEFYESSKGLGAILGRAISTIA